MLPIYNMNPIAPIPKEKKEDEKTMMLQKHVRKKIENFANEFFAQKSRILMKNETSSNFKVQLHLH